MGPSWCAAVHMHWPMRVSDRLLTLTSGQPLQAGRVSRASCVQKVHSKWSAIHPCAFQSGNFREQNRPTQHSKCVVCVCVCMCLCVHVRGFMQIRERRARTSWMEWEAKNCISKLYLLQMLLLLLLVGSVESTEREFRGWDWAHEGTRGR